MGYYMYLMEVNFRMLHYKQSGALRAIKGLAKRLTDTQQYSWVATGEFATAADIITALTAWRWEPIFDDDGNIIELNFLGEKLGEELELFDAIAPYVVAGSYIQMHGEDGEIWRWVFDGKICQAIHPKFDWGIPSSGEQKPKKEEPKDGKFESYLETL